MSRLTDLLAKAKAKDSQLGADLEREFKLLSSRLPFGLNFERHSPEAVELPLRPVRKGDKVRVLPERGSVKKGDQRLWQVWCRLVEPAPSCLGKVWRSEQNGLRRVSKWVQVQCRICLSRGQQGYAPLQENDANEPSRCSLHERAV